MALISRCYLFIYFTVVLKICWSRCFSQCSRLPSMCATVSTWVILLKCGHFSTTEVKVKKTYLDEEYPKARQRKKIKGKKCYYTHFSHSK